MKEEVAQRKKQRKLFSFIFSGLIVFIAGALTLLYGSYYISPRFKASMTLMYPYNSSGEVELPGASSEKIYYAVGVQGGPFNVTIVFRDREGGTVGAVRLENAVGNQTGSLDLEAVPANLSVTATCPRCSGAVRVSVSYSSFNYSAYVALITLGSLLSMSGAIAAGLASWLLVNEDRMNRYAGRSNLATQLPQENPGSDD